MPITDDDALDAVFDADTIAVIGCSTTPGKAAHEIPAYLQRQGYRVIPVNPFADEVLGETAYDAVGDVDADIDDVVETLLVAEKRATNVPPGTRESLDALAAENPLAVVTNGTSEFQREKLAHHDLTDYFETVVTAYDVGASKPDAAIFEAVREQIDAEEYVMVGDDYEADVEGARGAGFVPVHVEDTEDAPDFWATLQAFV